VTEKSVEEARYDLLDLVLAAEDVPRAIVSGRTAFRRG